MTVVTTILFLSILFYLSGCGLGVGLIGIGYDDHTYHHDQHDAVYIPFNCRTNWCANTRCGIWE